MNEWIDYIGWTGSILLALCGAPEAYYAFRNKFTTLSWAFILIWYTGEWFLFVTVLYKLPLNYIHLNYIMNIIFLTIVFYYKIKYPPKIFNIDFKKKKTLDK